MLESMLRDRGFNLRVTINDLKLIPGGQEVLKYVPVTPLYAEETLLQVISTIAIVVSMTIMVVEMDQKNKQTKMKCNSNNKNMMIM